MTGTNYASAQPLAKGQHWVNKRLKQDVSFVLNICEQAVNENA